MGDRDTTFDALWPLARLRQEQLSVSRRLEDNRGKRIGFIWDYMFRGDHMFPLIQAGLAEKFPGSTFVPYSTFGNAHGHDEADMLAALPQKLREAKVEAVVVGVAA
ncbi:MAG: hypothetical protein FJY55_04525 [Betaproteobacteria bacterium]|nr:hypothetical protein [Betaproteobacteria bacterium]